jgi:hypothetical protein
VKDVPLAKGKQGFGDVVYKTQQTYPSGFEEEPQESGDRG